jgi:hypothetical protein
VSPPDAERSRTSAADEHADAALLELVQDRQRELRALFEEIAVTMLINTRVAARAATAVGLV